MARLYNRDESHLRTARLIARESDASKYKMGAVIANGQKVLGLGCNKVRKTHPASNTPHRYIHAELAAMLNARCDLRGSTLYVYRIGKDDRPLISKPCHHCQALIEKEGIKTVVYTTTGGVIKMPAIELVGESNVRSSSRSTRRNQPQA